MKVKQILAAVLLAIFALTSFATGQDTPEPILKPGDVKHFIKTFPQLSKDFEAFGAAYEAKSGDLDIPEAMKANKKFLEILQDHGWDEQFFQKVGVIMMGYSAIMYKSEMEKAAPGIGDALKEIESNPALSKEMKEQLVKQMKAAQGALSQQQAMWQTQIHPNDIALIRPFVDELKTAVENNN
jgi:hypothetical protein